MSKITVLIALVLAITGSSFADECPIPMGSIDPKIDATVSFDSGQQLYTYNYTVSNGTEALLSFERFRILFPQKPASVEEPTRWKNAFLDEENEGYLIWDTSESDWLTQKGVQIWPSPFQIFPGKSMSGFVVKSKFPPGAVRFVASGMMTTIPKADPDPTGNDDEPVPDCPGMDFFRTDPYGDDVSGVTIGPVKPESAISLRLKVKPPKKGGESEQDDETDSGAVFEELVVNPDKDKGLLRAELSGDKRLSSEGFDVSKIDVASLRLGTGKAPAINARIAGKKLKVEFDLAKVGVRCDLDQALFLSGKTKGGQSILASVRVKKHLCKHTREAERIDLTPRAKKPKEQKGKK